MQLDRAAREEPGGGGAGIFTRNRLEQLFRDARLGRIHPGNALLTPELVGKLSPRHRP